jgi:outer membrane lipoprotein SlyB
MTGAAAGGIVGSQIGRGGGNAAAILAGVMIGGIAGAVAEDAATRQTGTEYVVEAENGLLMTLVQGSDPPFTNGQKVLVMYGSPVRLIAAP